jgi:hypothetical protein
MKMYASNGNSAFGQQSGTAVCRVIRWLQNYVTENPYTEAAIEARSLIRELQAMRQRPALDELVALIGQIAKSELGLDEISRAKLRMDQLENKTGEGIKPNPIGIHRPALHGKHR